MENEQTEGKKKSSPMVMTIAGVAILTLLGAGGGWFVGGMVAPKIMRRRGACPGCRWRTWREEGRGHR